MKKVLIVRLGAYGDMIIISPVIQQLKEMGYHIILNCGERGKEIYKHDTRIDEMLEHDESIPIEKVADHWDVLKKEVEHDLFINFSESIECNIALHPLNPLYVYPKKDREKHCNKNYYEQSFKWANMMCPDNPVLMKPSLMFTDFEHDEVKQFIKKDKFNILWCLSGSGKNKVYPWTDHVMGETIKKYKNVHFITIGDEKCQLLEDLGKMFPEENITMLAGKTTIRQSLLLTKYVNLVISPDTGVLHASGCFDTPKIGLLGHTTKENITKYFINDYSIESPGECSPCFKLIYEYDAQCPIHQATQSAWCMYKINAALLFSRIEEVMSKHGK